MRRNTAPVWHAGRNHLRNEEQTMGVLELGLTGVGLAMDAFAVSICKGLGMKKINHLHAFIIAAFFGIFQAVMPLIGWAAGRSFASYIENIDHWIAFALLVLIGGKMLVETFRGEEPPCPSCQETQEHLDYKELFLLAVATSIDALAVGVSLAFLGVNIWSAIAIIGIVTFVISYAGVVIGHVFGSRFEKGAQISGGIILILIGSKILLEHLGILNI